MWGTVYDIRGLWLKNVRIIIVKAILGSVDIYVRRVRNSREAPSGLGDQTLTDSGACLTGPRSLRPSLQRVKLCAQVKRTCKAQREPVGAGIK